MRRTLVAGFGSALQGDDGFGVEVIRQLEQGASLGPGVELMEVGTAGLGLVQDLLTPCDRLIIIDAMTRGGPPGTVYVLEVNGIIEASSIDPHLTIPSRALSVAKSLGVLPAEVFLIGAEPAELNDLTTELSECMKKAVKLAIRQVADLTRSEGAHPREGNLHE